MDFIYFFRYIKERGIFPFFPMVWISKKSFVKDDTYKRTFTMCYRQSTIELKSVSVIWSFQESCGYIRLFVMTSLIKRAFHRKQNGRKENRRSSKSCSFFGDFHLFSSWRNPTAFWKLILYIFTSGLFTWQSGAFYCYSAFSKSK